MSSVHEKRAHNQPVWATTAVSVGVVDRLALVMFAVELGEEPKVGPAQVDAGDEVAVLVVDLHLSDGLAEPGDGAHQLHHQCFQQALSWRRAGRTQGHDTPDPARAGCPASPQLRERLLKGAW